MKIKFKHQTFQTHAVEAVIDCFKGQPNLTGVEYRVDPGSKKQIELEEFTGFKNQDLRISEAQILENIRAVQQTQNLTLSDRLYKDSISKINLDVEMETGTGKTYCYIKTFFEMNRLYGWSKFIIVVPSIAIREGVYKSLQITAEHFLETYGKRAKFMIYDSKNLHNLETFSSDAGINIMIINVQAFNATGKDNRRIYEELDDFQSRKPIDVIKANRPILVLDEPQKMEGKKTLESLKEFNALMVIRYSATHKTTHNKIFRLDALDAYNQKLVKKISVRSVEVKQLTGTNAYLYLDSIEISQASPVAKIELEIKQKNGIKRVIRKLEKGRDLYDISCELTQYKGYKISEINALESTVSFTNGVVLEVGQAIGDVNEDALRRLQIREAIKAHLEKEQTLFFQGIKVLSLFFIDEVAKYRAYSDAGEKQLGLYAQMFEEEYLSCINELDTLLKPEYKRYLDGINKASTHNGYFAIDKKTNRLVDPQFNKRGESESNDADAYDLILKDKERLLSFAEPVRFIFSHSALREGWDNPNVFVICTLKYSDNTISRRQEVGRGLRLAVNQNGDRQDNPSTVHDINVLTVVPSESYTNFVTNLQKETVDAITSRPRFATVDYFEGKFLCKGEGEAVKINKEVANQIYRYLVKNDYTDDKDQITPKYKTEREANEVAELPKELETLKDPILELIDSVFCEAALPQIDNERRLHKNPLNQNFEKREFQALWSKINHKSIYSVDFDSSELISNCITCLNSDLHVAKPQYQIIGGEQEKEADYESLVTGDSFKVTTTKTEVADISVHSGVEYDLVGEIAKSTILTRRTIAAILQGVKLQVFAQFRINPESFIAEACRIIKEQKATVIVEHLAYDSLSEKYDTQIFTESSFRQDLRNAGHPLSKHVFDYLVSDSKREREFVKNLETSSEVVVYAKLPKGFQIPTPVGDYNPDWAISFKEGAVKHIYFIAETKGSLSSMELRGTEQKKIECAKKFFEMLNKKFVAEQVCYGVVDSYGELMNLVAA